MNEVIYSLPPEPFVSPETTFSSQPMLNGEYIISDPSYPSSQLHTILYYIDKNNPTQPGNIIPNQEPQFFNWEVPVIEWARQTIPNFSNTFNLIQPSF